MDDLAATALPSAPSLADRAQAPKSWMLWAVIVAGIGMVTGTLVLALASHQLDSPALRAFLIGWIVVPYIASGAIAWWRRPASRLGPLMLATGFAMALTPLQWSTNPWLYSIGHLLDMLPAAMFLHVFLVFPSGRISGAAERVLIIACYVAALGLQLVKTLVGVNPDSIFVLVDKPMLGAIVEGVQLSLIAALLLAGAVLLYLRQRATGRSRRRPSALVADAFGFALVMLALLYVAGLASWPAADTIRLITFAAVGLAPIAFLFALLDARLARGAVAGLLVELRNDPTRDLQTPLARALRDPSLALAYWLPQFSSWADQAGHHVSAPEPDERRAVRILLRDGAPMAALIFDRSLEDEVELIDAVAAAAAIALENGRLRAELRAQMQELQGSRIRVLEAGRKERQRLERNLHDGAQQRLVALAVELGRIGESPAADPDLKVQLGRVKNEVSTSLAELRDIARGIYPAVLTGHGLEVALESLTARAAVPIQLEVDLTTRPPEAVEVAAYYIVSEALTNIDKHAAATSAVVRVNHVGKTLVINVVDDGLGGVNLATGTGLRGLVDRVEALGGVLWVAPAEPIGTRVHAEIPSS